MKYLIPISFALASQILAHTVEEPRDASNDIQSGIFIITDPVTGLNLAIAGNSTDENAQLTLETPNDSNSQKFQIVRAGFQNYLIANLKSDLYLTYNLETAHQGNLTYTADQQWVIKHNALGNFVVEPHLQKKVYLAPPTQAGGNFTTTTKVNFKGFTAKPTTLNTEDGFKITKNKLISTTYHSDKKVAEGNYRFVVAGTTRALEVGADNKNIVVNELNKDNEAQVFKVEKCSHGHFLLVNKKTNQFLTTTGDKSDGGVEFVNAGENKEDGGHKQMYEFFEKGDNIWAIRNVHNKEMITAPETNGEAAVQQYFVGTPSQLFELQLIQ